MRFLDAIRQMHEPADAIPGDPCRGADERAERIERQIHEARNAAGDVHLRHFDRERQQRAEQHGKHDGSGPTQSPLEP